MVLSSLMSGTRFLHPVLNENSTTRFLLHTSTTGIHALSSHGMALAVPSDKQSKPGKNKKHKKNTILTRWPNQLAKPQVRKPIKKCQTRREGERDACHSCKWGRRGRHHRRSFVRAGWLVDEEVHKSRLYQGSACSAPSASIQWPLLQLVSSSSMPARAQPALSSDVACKLAIPPTTHAGRPATYKPAPIQRH